MVAKGYKHKNKRHSGRGKEGMILVPIRLTPEENEALIEMAEDDIRSRISQAAWIIREAIKKWKREAHEEQKL